MVTLYSITRGHPSARFLNNLSILLGMNGGVFKLLGYYLFNLKICPMIYDHPA